MENSERIYLVKKKLDLIMDDLQFMFSSKRYDRKYKVINKLGECIRECKKVRE